MRGSSEIPKSVVNSKAAPTTTGDTNAQLQNTTESTTRQKTRKPPLVRGRQSTSLQNNDAKTSKASSFKEMSEKLSSEERVSQPSAEIMNQHTAPVSSSSSSGKISQEKSGPHSKAKNLKEIAVALALRIQPALKEKELDQLTIVMKGMEENNLRFDRPPLVNYREIKEFIRTGIIKVIAFKEGAISDQAEDLLIRMIRLGCTANAMDELENSVLILACKAGRSELVKVLLTECPDLIKDWLNVHGQNAAMMAYKYDNAQLYPLLEKAGISQHPENPAIKLYLNSFDPPYYRSSDSKTEEYLELFEEDNLINLADENGQTLLFHAVIHEDVNFVSFLCQQKNFPNVSLRDKNQKSVFHYIKQIKDPEIRTKIWESAKNLALQTGSLQQLAKYTYSGSVLKKD
jgi:ankyrin repeat protein